MTPDWNYRTSSSRSVTAVHPQYSVETLIQPIPPRPRARTALAHSGLQIHMQYHMPWQVLSVPLILIGIGLVIYAYKTKHPQEGPRYDFDE